MKHFLLIILITCLFSHSMAQSYVEGGNTRHRFAQLNVGGELRWYSGEGTTTSVRDQAGNIVPQDLRGESELRLLIGGTHFWGHADFYIGIPLVSSNESGVLSGVETGIKLFPWRIEHGKLRPYLGTSLYPSILEQGHGATQVRFKAPLLAGLVYCKHNHLLELGAGYIFNNEETYYIDRQTPETIHPHQLWFGFQYKGSMETTLSAEEDWMSGHTKRVTDSLGSAGRLNGLTVAIGPSVAFFLKPSAHNAAVAPYVDNHKATHVFPDVGLGYYFFQPDVQLSIAYRSMSSSIDAYEFIQDASRKSLSLEAYRFWADYHGFAVFAGFAFGYEWLEVTEGDRQQSIHANGSWEGWRPGLTFGWDIRPNRLQSWYLRTNLRYFPNLDVTMPDNRTIPFDHLEFNFIQFVIFPGRFF